MRFLVIFFAFLFALNPAARADYVVWSDAQTGLSFSFPDTWQIVNNAAPDDVLTVMPPSGRAQAMCRLRAREDRRFMIYPARFGAAIQELSVSKSFWESYLDEFTNPEIIGYRDGAGLGRFYAGAVIAAYEDTVPGPRMRKRGVAFASLYNGVAYILECSAHEDAFESWWKPFLSIAGSVDFPKAYHENRTGNYRPFLDGSFVFFRNPGENKTTAPAGGE